MKYLLYNPLSGKGEAKNDAESFADVANDRCEIVDITKISDFKDFLEILCEGDEVYIFGGDGTLNRFINKIGEAHLTNDIYYYSSGTHNNFAVDVKSESKPILINHYIKRLPYVTVKDKKYRFINGITFGLDSYCVELEKRQKKSGQAKTYTSNAIHGVFSAFKPIGVTLEVDNRRTHIKKVWTSAITFGTHCGSGMIPAPRQKRGSSERKVSLTLLHSSGKLKTLAIMPSIFKGKHLKYKKNISVLSGNCINLKFDKEISIQIDGEILNNVKELSVNI